MAITILPKTTTGAPKIGSLELDAILRETHTNENDVTEHPVERGADITDHVRKKANGAVVEGVVSNTPIHVDPKVGRAEDAYEKLLKLHDKGELITIVTTLKVYENMAFVSLNRQADSRTADNCQFTATFKQVRIIDAGSVSFNSRKNGGKNKKDKGKQPTKEGQANEKTKSALKATYDWARD